MRNRPPVSRRSFLSRLSAGAAAGGALSLILSGRVWANENDPHNFGRASISDHDPTDRPGHGRGHPTTPATDNDPSPNGAAPTTPSSTTPSPPPVTSPPATVPNTTATPPPEAISDGDSEGDSRGQPAH